MPPFSPRQLMSHRKSTEWTSLTTSTPSEMTPGNISRNDSRSRTVPTAPPTTAYNCAWVRHPTTQETAPIVREPPRNDNENNFTNATRKFSTSTPTADPP
eukprot:m.75734 g.75734  ORF g.75734 m.75734 type:complete len:100 (+) comp16183_c0_seq2:4867-5166(+)